MANSQPQSNLNNPRRVDGSHVGVFLCYKNRAHRQVTGNPRHPRLLIEWKNQDGSLGAGTTLTFAQNKHHPPTIVRSNVSDNEDVDPDML